MGGEGAGPKKPHSHKEGESCCDDEKMDEEVPV